MMRGLPAKALVLLVLMVGAAALAYAAKPRQKMADNGPRVELESMIPRTFGDWQIDPRIVPVQVAPDVQARLDKIYSQTLARTYVNRAGQRVMLSIAYGSDQSAEASQVHRPEFCYASQGFQILSNQASQMATRFGALQVRQLIATQGVRHEPITYWITVGEEQTLPGIGRKLAQIRYGFTGTVPDGMLVRVSSIDNDTRSAYAVQEAFIQQLLAEVKPESRVKLIGAKLG